MAHHSLTRWIEEADARQVRETAMYDRLIETPCPRRADFRTLARITAFVASLLAPLRRKLPAGC